MYFDVKATGKKSTRDRSLIRLPNSPAIIASGISYTSFLPYDRNELSDKFKLLLQQKQAGNNCDIFNDGITAIVDKFLEYKCISTKQRKDLLNKCNVLHTKKK